MLSQTSASLPRYLQQEEILEQECIALISSLPKEKGWVASHLYKYQGFWNPPRHIQGIMTCQEHFEARDSDVFLVTTPKSGTTWLKAVMFTLINRMQYPINQEHPLLSKNPHDLVPFLEIKLYADNQIPDLSSFKSPRLFATHIPIFSLPKFVRDSSCKLVYLCRNPKDIFVSLWQFTNKLRLQEMGSNSLGETFDMFCRGVNIYGPFWDHVLEYWKESMEKPHKVFFLKYENMKERPADNLRCIAEFLGCPFSNEEEESGIVEQILKLCSFDTLSNLEINRTGRLASGEENKAFFRRGEVGDWKNHLPTEMAQKLDQITEQKFSGTGLKL
ncbi:cytosolic sulfotransferase 12-like [Olea europaea var. sylvestris]|uniref:Sulfotransferase n=1 Tax=Olea europaea subsp. europaea TaxID=158383 RepID=A0A8S0PUI2_OLEEU|nr:cytosolic sulfotransferase 12-like [Olea europaea var. sylvestris]CAA2958511.1 cytosolic sulfotransferase 12-like [Olea europaea subsp. europaea]